jgi:sugar phosphate isomerase/epimerase
LSEALSRLVDLEYTAVEIAIREPGPQLRPSQVAADLEKAVQVCRDTHRLTPCAYTVDIQTENDDEYYRQFTALCKLAKATKVVSITVPSSELGTPFNAEIERLRKLVSIATLDGVLVSIKTEIGRMSQDPATAVVLCDQVKGLGLTLDPSHYVCGPLGGANYQNCIKYVYHVQLRDSTKDELQVRVGQGEIDYGKLVSQLSLVHYQRALTAVIPPMPDVDQVGELRKLRLLLDSLL